MLRLLIPIVIALLYLFIPGCRKTKTSLNAEVNNEAVRRKLNNWLSAQQLQGHPRKNALLMDLKRSLLYENLQKEILNSGEEFWIIPVNKKFSGARRLPAGSLLQLWMVMNHAEKILRAGLVLFIPSGGTEIHELPPNTFNNIFHYGDVSLSGNFQFFTVTGQWIFRLDYIDGKPDAFSVVRKKQAAGKCSGCTDWELVITKIDQQPTKERVEVFPGRSCKNFCDEDVLPHACFEREEHDSFDDPNLQWVSNSISEQRGWSCGLERWDQVSGTIIKTCTYCWNYQINLLLWHRWKLCSTEELELEKSGESWKIRAIKHKADSIMGLPPAGVSFWNKLPEINTTLAKDSLTAHVELQYAIYSLRTGGFNTSQVFYGKTAALIKIP